MQVFTFLYVFTLDGALFGDDVKNFVSGLIIMGIWQVGGFLVGAWEWLRRLYIIVMPCLCLNKNTWQNVPFIGKFPRGFNFRCVSDCLQIAKTKRRKKEKQLNACFYDFHYTTTSQGLKTTSIVGRKIRTTRKLIHDMWKRSSWIFEYA